MTVIEVLRYIHALRNFSEFLQILSKDIMENQLILQHVLFKVPVRKDKYFKNLNNQMVLWKIVESYILEFHEK